MPSPEVYFILATLFFAAAFGFTFGLAQALATLGAGCLILCFFLTLANLY